LVNSRIAKANTHQHRDRCRRYARAL